jgi:hypothetical protein
MRSYEIQVFKGGKWEFDSYFDDRDSAMSDADQLAADVRIQGVRALKENYDQSTNVATCDVIFTRLRKKNRPGDRHKRVENTARSKSWSTGAKDLSRRPTRRKKEKKKSGSPVSMLVVFALIFLIGGVATLYGLSEIWIERIFGLILSSANKF